MNSSRFVIAVLSVIIVIGVVAGFVMYRNHAGPLEFTVTFKDARQLRPGQFVVYKGVRVGEVKSVELNKAGLIEVNLLIDSAHRTQICREATFRIEKPSLLDLSGEHQVTASDGDGHCTEISRNAVLQGSEGLFDDAISKGKQLIQRVPLPSSSH